MARLEEEIQRYKKLELGLYENFVEGIINKAEYTDFRENYRVLSTNASRRRRSSSCTFSYCAKTCTHARFWLPIAAASCCSRFSRFKASCFSSISSR
mgnify:CR=1 FL=1